MEHQISWEEVMAAVMTIWLFVQRKWIELSKIIEPIVKELDARAQDGQIDRKDRKDLAMKAIELLKQNGIIKLGFIQNFIVGRVVDDIAARLPDFKVSAQAVALIDKVAVGAGK